MASSSLKADTNGNLILQIGVGQATISYVYRGSTRNIIRRFGYPMGAFPITLAETLAIREVIRTSIDRRTSKAIMVSDSQGK